MGEKGQLLFRRAQYNRKGYDYFGPVFSSWISDYHILSEYELMCSNQKDDLVAELILKMWRKKENVDENPTSLVHAGR